MVVSLLSPNNTLSVPCVQALQEAPKLTKWRHHAILASYRTIAQPHDLDPHFHSFSLFPFSHFLSCSFLTLTVSSLALFRSNLESILAIAYSRAEWLFLGSNKTPRRLSYSSSLPFYGYFGLNILVSVKVSFVTLDMFTFLTCARLFMLLLMLFALK